MTIAHADACMINQPCPTCDRPLGDETGPCICRTPAYKCNCGADEGSGVPGSIESRGRYVMLTVESPSGMHTATLYREVAETQDHYIARVTRELARMTRDLA